jgi:hypothetical protein
MVPVADSSACSLSCEVVPVCVALSVKPVPPVIAVLDDRVLIVATVTNHCSTANAINAEEQRSAIFKTAYETEEVISIDGQISSLLHDAFGQLLTSRASLRGPSGRHLIR